VRAILLDGFGGPEVLRLGEATAPTAGPGRVLIRVAATSVNRPDLIQRQGNYPAPPGSPADIPGLEYAGEVDAVGGGSTMWPMGSRVMGIVGGGAHAELLCVNEREVLPMPEGLSFEECAAIPEVFLTAYDALYRQLDVGIGERVLVHAIGSGVGTAALQLAHIGGATVYGTSRSPEKLERARELGLVHAIDTASPDWADRLEALAGANAMHAVMDLVGGDFLRGNLRVLAPRGRLCVIGLTAGNRSEIDLGMVLRKRLKIIGTALRSRTPEEKAALAREFSQRVVPLFDANRLRPVVERVFAFAQIGEAHSALASNETFGKLVLRW